MQCFDCVVLRCWTISARYRAEIIMLDNGMAEALVKTIKRDYARVSAKPNAASVLRQLDSWFEHYNTVHPHKALRYRSPHEFRKHIVETTTENAVGAGRRPHESRCPRMRSGHGLSRRRRWRAAPACVSDMSDSLGVKVPCAT